MTIMERLYIYTQRLSQRKPALLRLHDDISLDRDNPTASHSVSAGGCFDLAMLLRTKLLPVTSPALEF